MNQTTLAPSLADLNVKLLYDIMAELERLRGVPDTIISTRAFEKLVDSAGAFSRYDMRPWYVNRHLSFLEQEGYIRIGAKLDDTEFGGIDLTAQGQKFVQPQLAEFGQGSMMPQIVKSLEKEILTYPSAESDGLLFNLREAVAKQAPDLLVKAIVEIGAKIASSKS